ncbi:MAG: zinc-dependent metalloprotease [Pseudomonadota bacterium]
MPVVFRCLTTLLLLSLATAALADTKPLPNVTDFSKGKAVETGLLDLVIDADLGHVYLRIPANLGEVIQQTSLARGLGSNDIGLDRGRLEDTRLVSFQRVGRKVLLTEHNTRFRASSTNPAELAAVTEAFAEAVIASFNVVASQPDSYLIDYTPYLLSDSLQLGSVIKARKQGNFKVDAERSAMFTPRTRAFVDNTELEATLTLTGTEPGAYLRSVAPDPNAFTVHVHHSYIRLPDDNYQPRRYHPESGYFPLVYADYSAPISADLNQRLIRRHRLQPGGHITYYLDPGIPEPVRSALLDGARWWNEAFAAAGFPDGFRVAMLPPEADPMDVRYNIIQWVHRSTRGWSYGTSITDPRTGEILKGKVTLGSLRIRQDLMIAQGLLSPFKPGEEESSATAKLEEMALARIRQLSAHEIGHTLGLAHNFCASTYMQGSVMDYPHPVLRLRDDAVDMSEAYDQGIGRWDTHAITYGYAQVPPAREADFLARQIRAGRANGLAYITDWDARPRGGAHPSAHLWDIGSDPVAALQDLLAVRSRALTNLGSNSLRNGTPFAELERLLVPIYYLHRYQTEAVVKWLGGVRYDYAVKGSAQPVAEPVPAAQQRAALTALSQTLSVNVLAPPAQLSKLLPPPPPGYPRDRESPPSRTLPVFDPVTLAEAAAEHTLSLLLEPTRLARVRQQSLADTGVPGVAALFEELQRVILRSPAAQGISRDIQHRTALLLVEQLLLIAWNEAHVPEVAAIAQATLQDMQPDLRRLQPEVAKMLKDMIAHAAEHRSFTRRSNVAELPPGSPI